MIRYLLHVAVFLLGFSVLSGCVDQKNAEMNLVIEAANGDLNGVKKYLQKTDGVDFISLKGETPLGVAAYNGHTDIVQFLVESGASVEFRNLEGKTAIDISEEQGHTEIYSFLIEHRDHQ